MVDDRCGWCFDQDDGYGINARIQTRLGDVKTVVSDLVARECEGVILGCTEIGLLLVPTEAQVPLFDTAEIHAERAALYALGEDTGT